MRNTLALLTAVVVGTVGSAAELQSGSPKIVSISALAFGPNGTLFIGDSAAASITAIDTGDTKPATKGDVNIDKLGDKLGSALGTTADNIIVNDVKVNPASGNIFVAVTRKGAKGGPIVMKLNRDGTMAEFALKNVPCASVKLPTGPEASNKRATFTSLAFVNGKVVVAGQSNEQFASTLWTIAYPFTEASRGTGIEIYHGAHGRWETRSPIQTFTPYQISGADYIMAAYTCTPLVKIPVNDLKSGAQLKGTTIAELGNRNKPLDMVIYAKNGKDYVLLANSARGVMKIPTDGFDDAQAITTKAQPKSGVQYETIEELKGVLHLDKLDKERAIVLIQSEDKNLSLKSIPLP